MELPKEKTSLTALEADFEVKMDFVGKNRSLYKHGYFHFSQAKDFLESFKQVITIPDGAKNVIYEFSKQKCGSYKEYIAESYTDLILMQSEKQRVISARRYAIYYALEIARSYGSAYDERHPSETKLLNEAFVIANDLAVELLEGMYHRAFPYGIDCQDIILPILHAHNKIENNISKIITLLIKAVKVDPYCSVHVEHFLTVENSEKTIINNREKLQKTFPELIKIIFSKQLFADKPQKGERLAETADRICRSGLRFHVKNVYTQHFPELEGMFD